jgi:hypothetical protein
MPTLLATAYIHRVRKAAARSISATKLLVRDRRIPRPLRWLAGIALLPIPGPLDEAVLLLIAPILFVFYRGPMREAWAQSGRPHA